MFLEYATTMAESSCDHVRHACLCAAYIVRRLRGQAAGPTSVAKSTTVERFNSTPELVPSRPNKNKSKSRATHRSARRPCQRPQDMSYNFDAGYHPGSYVGLHRCRFPSRENSVCRRTWDCTMHCTARVDMSPRYGSDDTLQPSSHEET